MKNRWFKKQQGFTLIEIIIVVIILGILASIGLPKVVENVNRVRVAEAFNVGNVVAGAFDRCLGLHSGGAAITSAHVLACSTAATLGVTFPPATNFNYAVGPAGAATNISLFAIGTGALAATDWISFSYNGLTGGVTKQCSGTSAVPDTLCQ